MTDNYVFNLFLSFHEINQGYYFMKKRLFYEN